VLARALAAFLLLPGTVAFLIPWSLSGRRAPHEWSGAIPFALGSVLLLWCVREFCVVGKGTLAPWSPPARLVSSGPYRVSRNPMYVAVLLILCGWAWMYRSRTLALYALGVGIAFHLRIVLAEEPFLARTDRDAWNRYKQHVPRWIGRMR
jgi:protein-S-isoprenylcysteine O-methyltransferase Ste14